MFVPLMLLLSDAPAAKPPPLPPIPPVAKPSVAVPPVIECPDQGTKPAGWIGPPAGGAVARQ